MVSESIIEETAVLMFALHQLPYLLSTFRQFLIGLTRVLPVALTHLAQVLVLQVECIQFFLFDLQPLLVVVHSQAELSRTVMDLLIPLYE